MTGYEKDSLYFGNFDADESLIVRHILDTKVETFYGIFGGLLADLGQELGDACSGLLKDIQFKNITALTVNAYIDSIRDEVAHLLHGKKIFQASFLKEKVLPSISYRLYIYWIIKNLEAIGFDIHRPAVDVQNALGQEIYNIFQDKALTTFFMVLTSYGIIAKTDNPINDFEEEKEIKILDINPKTLEQRLVELGAVQVFDGEIEDKYYDYPDLRLENIGRRSFRIRKKICLEEAYYYTIKRKKGVVPKGEPRICFEKEFRIHDFKIFEQILTEFGLKHCRTKRKQRRAYQFIHQDAHSGEEYTVKFDIDFYDGLPPLLEIEGNGKDDIDYFTELLGLQGHTTLSTGSRGLYHVYKKDDDYDLKYRMESGCILWEDGEEVVLGKK